MGTEQVPKEVEAVVFEAHTLGWIEFKDDEKFTVTEKGIEQARVALDKLSLMERFLVMVAVPEMIPDDFEEDQENQEDST
jgi:Mn-dependent DtxR family transcriptional regulator